MLQRFKFAVLSTVILTVQAMMGVMSYAFEGSAPLAFAVAALTPLVIAIVVSIVPLFDKYEIDSLKPSTICLAAVAAATATVALIFSVYWCALVAVGCVAAVGFSERLKGRKLLEPLLGVLPLGLGTLFGIGYWLKDRRPRYRSHTTA